MTRKGTRQKVKTCPKCGAKYYILYNHLFVCPFRAQIIAKMARDVREAAGRKWGRAKGKKRKAST